MSLTWGRKNKTIFNKYKTMIVLQDSIFWFQTTNMTVPSNPLLVNRFISPGFFIKTEYLTNR